jgi:hypothetical protein
VVVVVVGVSKIGENSEERSLARVAKKFTQNDGFLAIYGKRLEFYYHSKLGVNGIMMKTWKMFGRVPKIGKLVDNWANNWTYGGNMYLYLDGE